MEEVIKRFAIGFDLWLTTGIGKRCRNIEKLVLKVNYNYLYRLPYSLGRHS